MLYKSTVESATLDLIISLCNEPLLDTFYLVGGTALSLQTGSRKSIDIDLFSHTPYNLEPIQELLISKYSFKRLFVEKNSIKGIINNVFIDILPHRYPLVKSLIYNEGVRMASLHDIAAMKLNAIIGNGQRLKDFVDISFLSQFLTFKEMLSCYQNKYGEIQEVVVVKSLLYFDDINHDVEIDLLHGVYSFDKLKQHIEQMCCFPEKKFPFNF